MAFKIQAKNGMKKKFLRTKQAFSEWFSRQSINVRVVVVLFAAISLWMLSGTIISSVSSKHEDLPPVDTPSVRVMQFKNELIQPKITLFGSTESYRKIMLLSEVPGKVIRIFEHEGTVLKKDTPILELDPQGFKSRYEEAKAALKARKIERDATYTLYKKQLKSESNLAAAEAALDAAEAQLLQSQYQLEARTIKAPFDGKLNKLYVKIGSIIDKDPFGEMIGDGIFLVVTHISEKHVGRIEVGGKAQIRLVDGTYLVGKIRYISDSANMATRTYRIEIEIPNEARLVKDGLSAEVELLLPSIPAIHLPASMFVLDDDGNIGVRGVSPDDSVEFHPATIVDENEYGFWITGLSDDVNLITTGQGFVRKGVTVRTKPETRKIKLEGNGHATRND